MPVLLATGELDRKFTRTAARLLPRCAHGSHEVIAGAGHLPHLEQPARFMCAVRAFFAGAAGGRVTSRRGGRT
jgi:pimeloyl-ACP methyl ester carboxylesterase